MPPPMTPLAVALLFSAGATASAQDRDPLWKLSLETPIRFYRMTPAGVLAVATDVALLGVDPASGRIVWERADLRNARPPPAAGASSAIGTGRMGGPEVSWREVDLDILPGTPYGLVALDSAERLGRFEMVHLGTGERRWSSEPVPIAELLGHFQLPENHRLLLYGPDRETGRGTLAAVWLETGDPIWHTDSIFERPPPLFEKKGSGVVIPAGTLFGHQPPLFDSDTTAILYLTKDGPVRIDLRTGDRLWLARTNSDPPAWVRGHAALLYHEGVVYVPTEKRLFAFRVEDGRRVWNVPTSFKGIVVQMEMTPEGLLVWGTPTLSPQGVYHRGKFFLAMVDPATGTLIWKREEYSTPVVFRGEQAYLADDEGLHALDLGTGKLRLVRFVELLGDEVPQLVTVMGDHLLLESTQNLVRVDPSGDRVF